LGILCLIWHQDFSISPLSLAMTQLLNHLESLPSIGQMKTNYFYRMKTEKVIVMLIRLSGFFFYYHQNVIFPQFIFNALYSFFYLI
jgi:hypothetical protein